MYCFNERLKEIRKDKNLSQVQLAKIINSSQANIARWENKIQDPGAETIYKISVKLKVSADYLLGISDY